MHMCRLERLLPSNLHGKPRIHENTIKILAKLHQNKVQLRQKNQYRWIYIYINKTGMYGLKQAAVLAYTQLIKILHHLAIKHAHTLQAFGRTIPDEPHFAYV